MVEFQLKSVDEETLDTILAEDVDFSGDLSFKEPLMIRGRVSGTIHTSSDLHIDEKAVVEANIYANNVTVKGRVKGNITATGKVILFASCKMDGDIHAAFVTMEQSSRFNGICTMTGSENETGN